MNTIIIGSGPAGYTAEIYAARADLKPVIYTGLEPGGQLTTTTEVDNFPGYPQGVDGPTMMNELKVQAERFGTKVEVDFKKNETAQALSFCREVTIENKNLYHHVGIYSYTPDSINTFINLPKSKNEVDLSLEQMRAMDSNIPIGVTYVPEVPISVDTKEDLINIETNIREHNDKS